MGGFMEYEGNRPIRVLLPEELESYSLTGNGDFPRISKMEIEDKSKGDFIYKAVVILQTSWFVVQCIARGVQGLPITELELATVAFAGLNFVIYVLWWDKPLNVQCGVRVYKKRSTEEPVDDGHVEATAGFWIALVDGLSKLPAAIVHGPSSQVSDERPWLSRVLLWPVNTPIAIIVGEGDDKVGEKRVCTFYPLQWDEWRTHNWPLAMVVAGMALAFGGIHCIGWSFTFPSSPERTLWRVASISITSTPIVLFLQVLVLDCGCRFVAFDMTFHLLSFLQALLYIPSRLVLLILAFLCLRSLPPETYQTVHWSSFIPHL